jgi:hypothetical protein
VEATITTSLQRSSSVSAAGRVLRHHPDHPSIRTDRVYLLYTGIEATLKAARAAAPFAEALGVPLTVVHFRTVPYQLPIDSPAGISPIETASFFRRLRKEGIDARIQVYLCRDDQRTMPRALRTHSLVVLGGRSSWWPSRVERSRRLLEATGHFVIFIDTTRSPAEAGRHERKRD